MLNKTVWTSMAIVALLASCNGKNGGMAAGGGGGAPMATAVQERPALMASRKELCFMRLSGQNNTDTLQVHLSLRGDEVSGSMDEMPDGKDARHGRLTGLLQRPDIRATWRYTQEGATDTLVLQFRLGNDTLWQRPLTVDAAGRQVTDQSAGFTLALPLISCS